MTNMNKPHDEGTSNKKFESDKAGMDKNMSDKGMGKTEKSGEDFKKKPELDKKGDFERDSKH